EKNSEKLVFHVKDTGIGIPNEAKDKLFKPFSQVDSSTTRKYGGTGLGLAICTNLVQAMGGEIGVESDLKKGSDFFFTLPFKAAESQSTQTNAHSLKNVSVFVLDDNQTNRKILK